MDANCNIVKFIYSVEKLISYRLATCIKGTPSRLRASTISLEQTARYQKGSCEKKTLTQVNQVTLCRVRSHVPTTAIIIV